MTLRKLSIDNSVRYIPKNGQTKEKNNKPKTTNAGSRPRKQNKNISQNSKTFPKKFSASGFKYITN